MPRKKKPEQRIKTLADARRCIDSVVRFLDDERTKAIDESRVPLSDDLEASIRLIRKGVRKIRQKRQSTVWDGGFA